jgi:nucleoside-diphosphate-sugar epimerase
MDRLFCFGLGYSAETLGRDLMARGWQVGGTTRDAGRAARLAAQGFAPILWPGEGAGQVAGALGGAAILSSVPPDEGGDPVLRAFGPAIAAARPRWIGYFSTTGVYGDHQGRWVDEETPCTPGNPRASARLAAEAGWRALGAHVFRLAGIYGPGRNAIEALRAGTQRRIVKPGQIFSRIHVEDIAAALEASLARPSPGRVYNLADDLPCPPEDVVDEAARLLGIPPPPTEAFEGAALSPMARAFYADSKRVSNARLRAELGVSLRHPTYREGLAALVRGQARTSFS